MKHKCCLQTKLALMLIQFSYYRRKLYELCFFDLVDYKTVQIIYKVDSNLLPDCIKRLFETRESQYELTGD